MQIILLLVAKVDYLVRIKGFVKLEREEINNTRKNKTKQQQN